MVQLTQQFLPGVVDCAARVQRLLWPVEELGELKPPPRKPRAVLTKEKRLARRRLREKQIRRQIFLWGTKGVKKKQHKSLFYLFPDIPCDQVDAETQEMGALVIRERAAMVRAGWSKNKEHKANHYPAQAVIFEPLSDHESHLESRDYND